MAGEALTVSPLFSFPPLQGRQPSSAPHSPALLGPMPPPVSPGPQAAGRHAGAEAL